MAKSQIAPCLSIRISKHSNAQPLKIFQVAVLWRTTTWQSLVALAILGFQIDFCENGDFHKKKLAYFADRSMRKNGPDIDTSACNSKSLRRQVLFIVASLHAKYKVMCHFLYFNPTLKVNTLEKVEKIRAFFGKKTFRTNFSKNQKYSKNLKIVDFACKHVRK